MHALVLGGAILRLHDFAGGDAPVLAPNKGAWLAVAETDPPAIDDTRETASPDIAVIEGVPTRIWHVAPLPAPRWTWLQFIERFTESEQLAIVTASMSSAPIKLWYDKAVGAEFIQADEPRTVAGMQALVDAELISAERRAEILGA